MIEVTTTLHTTPCNDLQLAAMNEMKRTMKWREVLAREELKWSGAPLNCDETNDEATATAGECGNATAWQKPVDEINVAGGAAANVPLITGAGRWVMVACVIMNEPTATMTIL